MRIENICRKYIMVFLLTYLLYLPVISTTSSYLTVLSLNYEPSPALPGKQLELNLKVENAGDKEANDVLVVIEPEYPFTLKPGTSKTKYIGRLSPGYEFYVKYYLMVDSRAFGDIYKVKIRLCDNSCRDIYSEEEVEVAVEAEPKFIIQNISMIPTEIYSGSETMITLSLKNTGYGISEDTYLYIDTNPVPGKLSRFIIPSTGGRFYIGDIYPNKTVSIRFKLIASENTGGIYELPLKFTYRTSGKIKTDTIYFPVRVKKDYPDISIEYLKTVPNKLIPGETGYVRIGIKNLSHKKLKDIILSLNIKDENLPFYPFNASNNYVIKELHPDEFKDIMFWLISDRNAAVGHYKIPLSLRYGDESGNIYSREAIISIGILEKPRLFIQISHPLYIKKGRETIIESQVINKGAPARLVGLDIINNNKFKSLTKGRFFLKEIPSGTKVDINFRIYVFPEIDDKYLKIPIELTYQDELGNYYSDKQFITMIVYSDEDKLSEILRTRVGLKIIPESNSIIKINSTQEISFLIINTGYIDLKAIMIRFMASENIELLSTPVRYIEKLDVGRTTNIVYRIRLKPKSDNNYKIKFHINYKDIDNNSYQLDSEDIRLKGYNEHSENAVFFGDVAQVDITKGESDIFIPGKRGKVIINIVNSAPETVNFLRIKLKQIKNIEILSSDEVYIGKLESDDMETAEFDILVSEKISPGIIKIPLEIYYEDNAYKRYLKNRYISLRIYSPQDIKRFHRGNSSNATYFVFILIIILLYYWYKRRKRS